MLILVIPVQIQTFFSRLFALIDKKKSFKRLIRAHRSLPGPRGHDSVGWEIEIHIYKVFKKVLGFWVYIIQTFWPVMLRSIFLKNIGVLLM